MKPAIGTTQEAVLLNVAQENGDRSLHEVISEKTAHFVVFPPVSVTEGNEKKTRYMVPLRNSVPHRSSVP